MHERVELLDGGSEAFPRMLDAIAAAKRWIHLEVYTFSDEGVGRQFMDALGAAARRGVSVQVIIDGWGSATTGRSVKAQLEAEGVRVDIFHPLRTLFLGRFRRNHRKILVVDDEVSFIGGINIGDEYQNTADRIGWADLALEIEGPAAASLGRRIRREPPTKPVPSAVNIQLSGWGGAWRLRGRYVRRLREARARIVLAHGYFLPDRRLVRAILDAVKRGVDVRILLSGRSDVPFAKAAMMRLYDQFLSAGAKLFEWTHSVLHAKAAVIDGRITLIGSFNLDPFSLRNFETLVEVDDVDIASDTEGWMVQRIGEARIVALDEGRRPGLRSWLLLRVGLIGARLASFFGALMGSGPRHWP
jgi:cardiolipin synthase